MTSYELTHLKKDGAGLKNQITIILFKIWTTNRFSKAKSYNFIFINTMSHDLLVQMAYFTRPLQGVSEHNREKFLLLFLTSDTVLSDSIQKMSPEFGKLNEIE